MAHSVKTIVHDEPAHRTDHSDVKANAPIRLPNR
jgi:hypothetical protein